jgi:glycosyltransferase involved in cell wall biosynthesis
MAQRILVLSRTPIGRRMSSPGIRYLNLARVLRAALTDADVVLASPPVSSEEALPGIEVVAYDPKSVLGLTRRFDVVISMSFPVSVVLASLVQAKPLLVLDFFSQFYVEWMEVGRDLYRGLHRRLWTRAGQSYANLQLQVADYILCANERQRDAYAGVLGALGRLTPRVYDDDPTLRRLIDVAPHGLRPEPPPGRQPLRPEALPDIAPGDKLLLWLGGILYWYDPITLLRALARARKKHPELKLLFLGSSYPGGSELGQGLRYHEAVAEAKRLGLTGSGVFFHDAWLPHEAVVEYLAGAHAGVTTYFTNAETRFAHRTRFMDYLWAHLPIVCTEGDVLAGDVQRCGWGIAVPERDEDALAAALTRLAEDAAFTTACRQNLEAAADGMTWETAFEPLITRLLELRGGSPAEQRSARRAAIMAALASYGVARGLEIGSRLLAGR